MTRGSGVKYHGTVSGLKIDDKTIGEVSTTKTFSFQGGTVTVNKDGQGLIVKLTGAVNDYEVGTKIVVADVTAHAVDGAQGDAHGDADRDAEGHRCSDRDSHPEGAAQGEGARATRSGCWAPAGCSRCTARP